VIYQAAMGNREVEAQRSDDDCGDENDEDLMSKREDELSNDPVDRNERSEEQPNRGCMLVDATACPQDIAYPTYLELLNAGRMKCEEIIDRLYDPLLHGSVKPRTYREKARKAYLNTAKKKKRTRAELKVTIGKQLRYVNRDLKTIDRLLCAFAENPLNEKERTYVETIRKVLVQQTYMRRNKTHSVVDRIVSIHQPQVRPIDRGKEKSKVEFGLKINVSLVEGYSFLDHLSCDAYNEGGYLMKSVELYKDRHGYYPAEVLADMIYCNRENRRMLKDLGIKLLAKPLRRPSATNSVKLNPGDRNPIEGKFGQAKVRYGWTGSVQD